MAPRSRLGKDECSWWLAGKRRLSVSTRRCDRLGKRLPPGSYRVLVRARDTAGNVSELSLQRASRVKVGSSRR